MNRSTLWLCLLVAMAVQQASSDHQSDGVELRDVASVINGSPLKPLSFFEKSITKDIDLLAKEIGDPSVHVDSLEDIDLCIGKADRLIEKYIGMFSSGRITKKRIDERNAIERASALLRALPLASETCDLMSYLDLMAIFKAAAGDSGQLHATDQVRSAIVAAIRLHRTHCSAGYYQRLSSALDGIEAGVLSSLDKLLDSSLLERIFPGYSKDPMVVFEAKDTAEALVKNSHHLLDRVIDISRTSDNPKEPATDEDGFFTETLPRLLLDTCKSFIRPLEGILLPAKIDMALLDAKNPSLMSLMANHRELGDAWARFHICSSIHYNEPAITRGLREEFTRRFKD